MSKDKKRPSIPDSGNGSKMGKGQSEVRNNKLPDFKLTPPTPPLKTDKTKSGKK